MSTKQNLSPAGIAFSQKSCSPEDQKAFTDLLWRLCACQAARYTHGESSSLPEETVRELLESLAFSLFLCLSEGETTFSALLQGKEEKLLLTAWQLLGRRLRRAKMLYRTVLLGLPGLSSAPLRETLESIGLFESRYDLRFFAHELPCSIDYPLCLPVEDSLQGVLYLSEYLRRLAMENRLLRRCDPALEEALLHRCRPGFEELPLNLCEPVLTNALGRVLLGLEPGPLFLPPSRLEELTCFFLAGSEDQLRFSLGQAAGFLCQRWGLSSVEERYFSRAAVAVLPRAAKAAPQNELSHIFIPAPLFT
ncbi:MAG: DUF6179 domain-containing protein [Oscillospiraceae bacterium]|nr:DUF6179 domain-containing protein [Oscillospiraceae bacterium]